MLPQKGDCELFNLRWRIFLKTNNLVETYLGHAVSSINNDFAKKTIWLTARLRFNSNED